MRLLVLEGEGLDGLEFQNLDVNFFCKQSSNLGGLHSRPDHRKDQDKHSLLPALGDTLETKEEDNREMLKDGDEPEQ